MTTKTNLTIHIGTERTDTTKIQNYLKANRKYHLKKAIYISKDPMIPSGNQRWLAEFAYNSGRVYELISTQGYQPKVARDQDTVDRHERLKTKSRHLQERQRT